MNNNSNQTQVTLTPVESSSPFVDKIRAYIANKGSATLKQIQSRFKDVPYTCEDYWLLLNRCGFQIEGNGPISLYVVKL